MTAGNELKLHHVVSSLGPVAFIRSIFKSLKAELVWGRDWHTRRDVKIALFEYINGFYNPRRSRPSPTARSLGARFGTPHIMADAETAVLCLAPY